MAPTHSKSDYVLSRDYIDCTRLNLQHTLWTQIFGYLLHPRVDVSRSNLKVADVCTGTGKWLVDVSHQLPEDAELEGFDLDISQAAPRAWLPDNITLRKWDMTTELLPDMVGKYDIVHVKLLVFVVKTDPMPLLEKLLKMLKPGGWLQWSEPDVPGARIVRTDPENDIAGLERLFSVTAAQDPRLIPTWPVELDETFRRVGLEDVELHSVQAPNHLEYQMHQCNLLIYDMIASHVSADAAAEIRELVPKAALETRNGAMITFPRVTAVGRKAMLK